MKIFKKILDDHLLKYHKKEFLSWLDIWFQVPSSSKFYESARYKLFQCHVIIRCFLRQQLRGTLESLWRGTFKILKLFWDQHLTATTQLFLWHHSRRNS